MYENRAAGAFCQKGRMAGAVFLLPHISARCKYSRYVQKIKFISNLKVKTLLNATLIVKVILESSPLGYYILCFGKL